MDAKAVLNTVTILTNIWPGGRQLHDLLVKYHDQIESLAPIIENIGEAGSALAAAEKAAPELAAAIKDFVRQLPPGTIVSMSASPPDVPAPLTAAARENVARVLLGRHAMTPDEEAAWMAAQTASVGDPRFGG